MNPNRTCIRCHKLINHLHGNRKICNTCIPIKKKKESPPQTITIEYSDFKKLLHDEDYRNKTIERMGK